MKPLNLLDSATPYGGGDRALIWRELRWIERQPVLEIEPLTAAAGEQHPSGERIRIPLTPGAFLGLRLLADTAGEHLRYCAGYFASGPSGENTNTPNTGAPRRVPCPEGARIHGGKQCERCAARDEFTALHTAHLHPGTLTPGMRAYAATPHRLYIATFPDGTSKVGTSSQASTPRRLDEQAPAVATYIAQAPDGLSVREAEDAVTRIGGVPQVKQTPSKYRAWLNPLPNSTIRSAHQETMKTAREALTHAQLRAPLTPLNEPWEPSPAMARPYAALRAGSPEPLGQFPSILSTGTAGFYCTGAAGKFMTAHTGDPAAALLVNTAEIDNLAITVNHDISTVNIQTALF